MAQRDKSKLPFNEKARLVLKLEEVSLTISGLQSFLKNRKSHPKLEKELKQLADKYLKLGKQLKKRYRLTDEEVAFVEAELTIELVIYAKDLISAFKNSDLTKKYLPKTFKTGLRDLAKQALKIRRQFPLR